MSFDEVDFLLGKAVLLIELLINVGDRGVPVDVGFIGKVLEGDIFPNITIIVLRDF